MDRRIIKRDLVQLPVRVDPWAVFLSKGHQLGSHNHKAWAICVQRLLKSMLQANSDETAAFARTGAL